MIHLPITTSSRGPRSLMGQLWTTIAVEINMQWRRWGFWLAFMLAGSIVAMIYMQNAANLHNDNLQFLKRMHISGEAIINTFVHINTSYSTTLYVLIASLLVSDRLPRDRQLGMLELQRTTPLGHAIYVMGKFLGNYIAFLVPSLIAYLICGCMLVWFGVASTIFPKLALSFTLIFLPASAAAIALTLLCSSLFPLRMVQIGFPLLWLDATISILNWPTISRTIFNAAGRYIYPVFFPYNFQDTGITLATAQLNISLLLLTAFISLVLLYLNLEYQAHKGIER